MIKPTLFKTEKALLFHHGEKKKENQNRQKFTLPAHNSKPLANSQTRYLHLMCSDAQINEARCLGRERAVSGRTRARRAEAPAQGHEPVQKGRVFPIALGESWLQKLVVTDPALPSLSFLILLSKQHPYGQNIQIYRKAYILLCFGRDLHLPVSYHYPH